MSSLDISLSLNGTQRLALRGASVGAARTPLRIVLCCGETLALPRKGADVKVLSGRAWITEGGKDLVLDAGASTRVGRSSDSPLISSLGVEPVLVEVV